MALTLQQRVDIAGDAAFVAKVDACLKLKAGLLRKGDLVKEGLPMWGTFSPSDSQVNEWCNRISDQTISGMTWRMLSSIISDPGIETLGASSLDPEIDAAVLWNILPYAANI